MSATPAPDPYYADPRLAVCYDTIDGDRDDLDHYQAIVAELGAKSVIDLGCGTGSLAVRLAAAGIEVTGVDPAAASVELARDKERGLAKSALDTNHPPVPITWIVGDATAIPALGADLAVMTGNVAQVFTTDESWAVTLRGLRHGLRLGGHLVFEARRPEARGWEVWRADTSAATFEVPGVGTVTTHPTDFVVDLPIVTFSDDFHLPDGSVVPTSTSLRFRDETELRSTVTAAGFEVTDLRQAPDRPGQEFVVIARAV